MKEQGEEPPLPNILFTVLAAIRNPLALEDRFPAKVLAFKKRVNIWLGGKGKTNRLCRVRFSTVKTSPVSSLPKLTTVFGVPVFAASTAAQTQRAASVLAAWLDSDGDGCVDNPCVLTIN